jgi:hypothetical protein
LLRRSRKAKIAPIGSARVNGTGFRRRARPAAATAPASPVPVESLVSEGILGPAEPETRRQRGLSVYLDDKPLPSLDRIITWLPGRFGTVQYRRKGRACSRPADPADVI